MPTRATRRQGFHDDHWEPLETRGGHDQELSAGHLMTYFRGRELPQHGHIATRCREGVTATPGNSELSRRDTSPGGDGDGGSLFQSEPTRKQGPPPLSNGGHNPRSTEVRLDTHPVRGKAAADKELFAELR